MSDLLDKIAVFEERASQLEQELAAARRGEEILGIWHSHVSAPATVSHLDLRGAPEEWLRLIARVDDDVLTDLRAWDLVDGQPVEVAAAAAYPKPEGLDALTADQIEEIQFGAPGQASISPCLTLDQIPDDGVAALGRQADPGQWAEFSQAFYEAGLG